MKLVREHINEKFTQDTDPVQDMGIGIIEKLKDEYLKRMSTSWRPIKREDISLDDLLYFSLSSYLGNKNIDVVEALIDAGANIKNKTSDALTDALYRGKDFVKLLLDKGANPNAKRCEAFVTAVWIQDFDIAQMILDAGANVHAQGDLALRQASKYNHPNAMKWLLDRGANPNTRNYYCLQYALRNKNFELADQLVKYYIKDRKI